MRAYEQRAYQPDADRHERSSRSPGKRTLLADRRHASTPVSSNDAEDARAVVETVTAMIDNAGLVTVDVDPDEGTAHPHDFTADVPTKYRSLILEWTLILGGRHRPDGGGTIMLEDDMALEHLDMAMASMGPLLVTLEGSGEGVSLAASFHAKVKKLRAALLRKDTQAAVHAAADHSRRQLGKSFDAKAEDEQLGIAIEETLRLARRANTIMQRFAGDDVYRLDNIFKASAKNLAPIPEIKRYDADVRAAKTTSAALQHAAGYLNLLSAIYAVADPTTRSQLWDANAGILGKTRSIADMAQLAGQLVSGCLAIVGTASYAAAKVNGDAGLAKAALQASGKTLGKVGFVLNVIGVIRGIVTLLDPDASGEEKAEAVVDTAASGLGIAARVMPTFTAAGPAAFALVVTFYTMKGTIEHGVESYGNLIRGGLQECFDDMRERGKHVNDAALELAIAAGWNESEADMNRRDALAEVLQSATMTLVDAIAEYLQRAATSGRNRDPGTWKPLRDRFARVAPRTPKTADEALTQAAQVIEVMIDCLTNADMLFVECAEWAMEEYG